MALDLGALLGGQLFAFLLIFCRVGGMFMVMPGLGESFVPARLRLQIALAFSFILLPFLAPHLPAMPKDAIRVAELIGAELTTGIFFGLILRLLLSALEIAGMFASMQTGLSNAMILNPAMASQGSVPGALLSMLGIVILFESNLSDNMLRALAGSYDFFKPGVFLPVGDMSQFVSQTVNASFSLALKLAAPFMVLGIAFQLVAGLMVKMVPQMQIFFVAAPLQILLGLAILAFILAAMMGLWVDGFREGMMRLFTGGGTAV
ncbi:MAG: flagellar biosynthetic protein FliR [Proteobacteria bacterium]|nr:flagellar biosynthetic protein FliR [Pseudomonadota bacterium]